MKKLLILLALVLPTLASANTEYCSIENGKNLIFQTEYYNSLLKGTLIYQDDNLLKQVTESLDNATDELELFMKVCEPNYD